GADLGHQEDLVALALEGAAQVVLGAAVPVLPAVVEEGDPAVEGLVDQPDGLLGGLQVAQVMPAQPQGRNLVSVAAEWPSGGGARCGSGALRGRRGGRPEGCPDPPGGLQEVPAARVRRPCVLWHEDSPNRTPGIPCGAGGSKCKNDTAAARITGCRR